MSETNHFSQHPKLSAPAIKGYFADQFMRSEREMAFVNEICSEVIQTEYIETDFPAVESTPQLKLSTADINVSDLSSLSIKVKNQKYDVAIKIPYHDFRHEKLPFIKRKIQTLAGKVRSHWNRLAIDALAGMGSNIIYDDQTFFSATHYRNQSNLLSHAVGSLTNPESEKVQKSIYDSLVKFRSYYDSNDEYPNQDLTNVHIIYGSTHAAAIDDAIQKMTKTQIVDINQLSLGSFSNSLGGSVSVTSSFTPMMDNAGYDDGYIICLSRNEDQKPILRTEFEAPTVSVFGASNSEFDKYFRKASPFSGYVLVMADVSRSVHSTRWENAIRVNFTAS